MCLCDLPAPDRREQLEGTPEHGEEKPLSAHFEEAKGIAYDNKLETLSYLASLQMRLLRQMNWMATITMLMWSIEQKATIAQWSSSG